MDYFLTVSATDKSDENEKNKRTYYHFLVTKKLLFGLL